MRPRHVNTLLGRLVAVLTVGVLALAAPSAHAAEVGSPVIVSPTEGQVIDADFSGPVSVDFTGAEPGSWTVGAFIEGCNQPAGTSRCASWAQVDVGPETGVVNVTLPETLGRSGDYVAKVMRTDGLGTGTVQIGFTIVNATDDTEPDPVAEGGGRIISPTQDADVSHGFRGPIVVDFYKTSAPVEYLLDVYGPGAGHQVMVTSSGGRTQIDVPALKSAGEWTADLYRAEDDYFLDEVSFNVGAAPPVVSIRRVSPQTFYPTVRDGFRDSVWVRYRIDQRATVSFRVRNADGRVVASKTVGRRPAGANSFTWNGRNNQGDPVAKGRYRIEVTATNDTGGSGTAKPVAVVATTDVVTRQGSDSWRGTQTDRRSKRGNCHFYGYAGELTLDCWAGNYARAEWDFQVPKTATNVRYRIYGHSNCCSRGTIKGSGKWASRTRVTVGLTVTYWRSYTVRRVGITYQYKVRR